MNITDRIITATPRSVDGHAEISIPLRVDDRVQIAERRNDGYAGFVRNLTVIVSLEIKSDGKIWIHGSVSRRSGALPSFEHLKLLKDIAFGPLRKAVQIFPPDAEYISSVGGDLEKELLARGGKPKEVLHLWGPYEQTGDGADEWLPDMRGDGRI